jgi:guanylate kinase
VFEAHVVGQFEFRLSTRSRRSVSGHRKTITAADAVSARGTDSGPAQLHCEFATLDQAKQITAAIFSAFIKCPTKAYLLASSEHRSDDYFAEMTTRISSAYKGVASRTMLFRSSEIFHFEQLLRD